MVSELIKLKTHEGHGSPKCVITKKNGWSDIKSQILWLSDNSIHLLWNNVKVTYWHFRRNYFKVDFRALQYVEIRVDPQVVKTDFFDNWPHLLTGVTSVKFSFR